MLSSAITAAFEHEFRLSKSFDLIASCDFADAATRSRQARFLRITVEARIEKIEVIQNELSQSVNDNLDSIKKAIENKRFVESGQIPPDLNDVDDIEWKLVGKKFKKVTKTRQVAYWQDSGRNEHGGYTRYRTEEYVVREPDKAFNKQRYAHNTWIVRKIDTVRSELEQLEQVSGILASLHSCRDRLQENNEPLVFDSTDGLMVDTITPTFAALFSESNQ
ncbi:MAG: hypothetical protein AAGK09_01350 [Planctomycetota bacterium]